MISVYALCSVITSLKKLKRSYNPPAKKLSKLEDYMCSRGFKITNYNPVKDDRGTDNISTKLS